MKPPDITVIIPTFNRPNSLKRAVDSLFRQTYRSTGFELIIVDNSPDASASEMVEALKQTCPVGIKLIALHAPEPGVSNARNCALEQVKTQLVAFLDDDQSAPENWLKYLLAAYQQSPAILTFGPVATKLPESIEQHRAYYEHFFAREPEHETGYIDGYYGCGNAMLDLAAFGDVRPRFDPKMNQTGGEDDLLFREFKNMPNNYAWAEDAHVYEHPLPKRITLTYTLRRAFSYGQAPVTIAFFNSPPHYLTMLKWIGIGAVKSLAYAAKWLGMLLIRHPRRVFALDQSIRGLGKVIWFLDFQAYGTASMTLGQPKLAWIKHPGTQQT